jgi:hypothetical protein
VVKPPSAAANVSVVMLQARHFDCQSIIDGHAAT